MPAYQHVVCVPTPDDRLVRCTDELRSYPPAAHTSPLAKRAGIAVGDAVALAQARALWPVAEVDAGGVPALLVDPTRGAAVGTLVGLHGGGYVLCSAATHVERFTRMGVAAGWRTLVVDYRLAPEHPFPAALDDACAAVSWAQARFGGPVALVGDSAGGALVLATLLHRRDRGDAPAQGAVSISPWADLTCSAASHTERRAIDPFAHLDDLPTYASMYAGGRPLDDPLLSPVHGDYRDLPPLLVQIGSTETLYDDAVAVATAAASAGVATRLEEWQDMFHTWHGMAGGGLHGADEAVAAIGAFLRPLTG